MKKVISIFRVDGHNYRVEGSGQETVYALRELFPQWQTKKQLYTHAVLKGFEIDGVFHEAYI